MTTDRFGLALHHTSHDHCVLCGARNPLSLGLCFEPADDGAVCARFRGHGRLQGYAGILHGGVISALLDSAMTHCLFQRGIEAVTGDLRVRFLRPVPCTEELMLRAWVKGITHPLYRMKSEIRMRETKMAWAEARFMHAKGAS